MVNVLLIATDVFFAVAFIALAGKGIQGIFGK